ncbi:hypothetical protein ABHA01_12450 [Clostridium paraputrificum]
MNILLILEIIGLIVKLLHEGISENDAISTASAKFKISKDDIKRFL